MVKNFGAVCAAFLIAAATFSSSAQARDGGSFRGSGSRMDAAHFGGARIGGAHFAGGRVATAGGHYYGGKWAGPRGYYGYRHRGYWPYWGWGIAAAAGALAVSPYYDYGYYDDDGYYGDGWNTWNGCPPNYTIQDGVCRPYRGY